MEYRIGDSTLDIKIAGTLETAGVVTTTKNIGSVPDAVKDYISVAEYGDGVNHTTVLTLTALPIYVDSTATNAVSFGNVGIYKFPVGTYLAGNSFASIALSVPATMSQYIADTDADGDYAIGTTADANGSLAAAESNLIASTAIAIADQYAAPATAGVLADASRTLIDGSSAAKTAYLNLVFDAGEVTVVTDALLNVTGTVVLEWKFLG